MVQSSIRIFALSLALLAISSIIGCSSSADSMKADSGQPTMQDGDSMQAEGKMGAQDSMQSGAMTEKMNDGAMMKAPPMADGK